MVFRYRFLHLGISRVLSPYGIAAFIPHALFKNLVRNGEPVAVGIGCGNKVYIGLVIEFVKTDKITPAHILPCKLTPAFIEDAIKCKDRRISCVICTVRV